MILSQLSSRSGTMTRKVPTTTLLRALKLMLICHLYIFNGKMIIESGLYVPKDKQLVKLLASYYTLARAAGHSEKEMNNDLSSVGNVADVQRLLNKLGDLNERTGKK
jgi:hypothetical protein